MDVYNYVGIRIPEAMRAWTKAIKSGQVDVTKACSW
jgi:hypothetical protein